MCEKRLLASSRLSVRPSICIKQLKLPWSDFHEILYLNIFRKPVKKIQVSSKSDEQRVLHMKNNYIFIIPRSIILGIRNASGKNCTENQNTNFTFNNFFPKIVLFKRQCGKTYSRTSYRWRYTAA